MTFDPKEAKRVAVSIVDRRLKRNRDKPRAYERSEMTTQTTTMICGCMAVVDGKGCAPIAHCPLHAAAPNLAQALRDYLDAYAEYEGEKGDWRGALDDAADITRQALTEAGYDA